MKVSYRLITFLLFVLAALCFVFFDILHMQIIKNDDLADYFLTGSISRLSMSLLFGWMFYRFGGKRTMSFTREFFSHLKWALPCFVVAVVNFPFSSLISGTSQVIRLDIMYLYVLYIISISLLEEFVFRGGLLILISEYMRNKRHKYLWTTVIASLIFSLIHLTNLFEGADVLTTLLQCLYTFLIGAMLTVTMIKLKNIWLCVLIHAIFDFGGLLIIHLGIGNAWDTIFWILTIISGVLCAGHIIFSLIRLEIRNAS